MPKVVWTPENDRRLLIRLIERSAKAYDTIELAKLFNGATPKAIEERIAKLKREAKHPISSPEKGRDTGRATASPQKRKRAGSKGKRARKNAKLVEDDDDDEMDDFKEEAKIKAGGETENEMEQEFRDE